MKSPLIGLDVDGLYFTLVTFGPLQRITLTPQPQERPPKIGLFFTQDELNEVLSRFTIYNCQEMFTLNEEA